MRTWMRSKVRLLFMTCAVLLAIPAIALADNAVADGDGVTPITDNPTMDFGNVGCNVASTNKALIAISRNGAAGSTNVFKNSSTVTVTAAASGDPALSAAMDSPNTISIPSNWSTTPNNTLLGNVSSTVTVNDSAAGAGSGTVTFTATGKNSSDATIQRTDTVDVTWNTGSCDTTAPSVSSIATANTNPTNTTGNVSWDVTFSENVTGVNAGDFNLANTGLGGSPAITNVSGSGASYTVTASSGSGSGTLGLNLTDNDSIVDGAGNELGGTNPGNGDFTGDVYVIDRAAPTMTGSAVLGPNFAATDTYTAGNWTNQSVRVTFTCADTGGSGLTETSGNQTLADFTAETDANGATATSGGTCVDNAGNTAASSTFGPIKIDKTNPTINGSRTPAANSFGWNNGNVAVSFNCTDTLSDIATCVGNTTLSSEGAGQSVQGTATDNAGNTATDTVSGINIDKTNPVVNVTGVSNGATYTLGSVPAAGCSTSDALSGVDANATLQPLSGGPVGSVTATCSGASDKAGNPGSASVTYNVNYNWSGFFQPIDNNVPNKAKAGSVIPVKFSLGGDQGLNIFYTADPQKVYPTVVGATGCATGTADLVEEYAPANASGLKYDPLANQYIYNWKTQSNYAGKCLQLNVKLADGTTHSALFTFIK